MRPGAGLTALSMAAAIVLGLLWASPIRRGNSLPPHLTVQPEELPADGYAIATLRIESSQETPPRLSVNPPRGATVQEVTRTATGWLAKIRAGVTPANLLLRVETPGLPAATAKLTTLLDPGDFASDGTPDFSRLDDHQDRRAFRRWFPFLAEAQYFQPAEARPAEIDDCAALIRYAYREALRKHDSQWAGQALLPLVPGWDSVARYQYPYTPLGANLFRVREGSFRPADLNDQTFAQFADAQTLRRYNTYFVSRDISRALPGDLLFYRQESDHMPFHSMIYVGESAIVKDGARYVVYHTGPENGGPGLVRRLALPELQRYPEPQWRPVGGNPNFLGVYRWNILREAS